MWAQLINTFIGIWLMVAPAVLGYNDAGSDNNHIVGPLVVTFAFVAVWEATRGLRKVNILFGIWLLLAPWVLGYEETGPIVNDMVCGALIIVFSLVKGKVEGKYGGGWKSLWQSNSLHEREAERETGG
ncbi:MAG TPA: SPW repeat protein [Cyclobacteriaceae bacterium]|nr:SPW repeat protein [Cyclobacteriaceae bacterium]